MKDSSELLAQGDLSFLSQEFKQEMLGGYVRTPQSLGGHGNKNFSLVT